MKALLTPRHNEQEESHWLSVSDLMAGLMMVFLFIAVAFMLDIKKDKEQMQGVADAYQQTQTEIYQALFEEFESDLKRWNAEIPPDSLTFVFRSPDLVFDEGKTEIKPEFKALLSNFGPRYFAVLKPFESSIKEIRIEGHTSSGWNKETPVEEHYFKNMKLSQDRTRSVLAFLSEIAAESFQQNLLKEKVVAVGYSSSQLILNKFGKEDKVASRRVNFTVITNADAELRKLFSNNT